MLGLRAVYHPIAVVAYFDGGSYAVSAGCSVCSGCTVCTGCAVLAVLTLNSAEGGPGCTAVIADLKLTGLYLEFGSYAVSAGCSVCSGSAVSTWCAGCSVFAVLTLDSTEDSPDHAAVVADVKLSVLYLEVRG